ncbi:MAG TPA: hypothetical protein VJ820_18465 [Propionibacteriaceae bacterium]|jgi:hypothetical protein|nr:hypothetical protein [Propionibacteriaceae bacterium]
MTNPYEENPPTQPSQQPPYSQPGQYPQSGEQPGQYPQSGEQPGQYAGGQPAPYGQQSAMPYGQQPYTMPPMQEHPQGTMILIFGILGIFITIFAPIAWYLGNKAKQDVQTSGIQYSNEQNISIGRMLGKVFTIIAIVSIVLVIIFWIVIAVVAGQSGG